MSQRRARWFTSERLEVADGIPHAPAGRRSRGRWTKVSPGGSTAPRPEGSLGSFRGPGAFPARIVEDDHRGHGPIHFRRLFDSPDFGAPVDFVDFTLIPPGSSIGYHRHVGNEELYLIVRGRPLVKVGNETRRLHPGDVAVVRSQQCHGLINDGNTEVAIFVVQIRL